METKTKRAQPASSKTSLAKGRSSRTVTFGSVTIEVLAPSKAEVKRNIKAGQEALARARRAIIRPGVKLNVPKGVPLFHADPDHPDRLVRVLHGKCEYGVFVNGKFKRTSAE